MSSKPTADTARGTSEMRHERKSAFLLKRTFPVLQNEVSADFRVRLQGVSQLDWGMTLPWLNPRSAPSP